MQFIPKEKVEILKGVNFMKNKSLEKEAIEKHCLECWDDNKENALNCPYNKCPLWKFRLKEEKKGEKN